MRSITYWHPFLYSLLLRVSFRKHYLSRYQTISDLIPPHSSVLDVCCGDCKIYDFLKLKHVDYRGVDFNSIFVNSARARGIQAYERNIKKDVLPQADIVLLQGSLYQFIPDQVEIVTKLLTCAKKAFILCEPIKNHAASNFNLLSKLACVLNNPGDGIKLHRFNLEMLKEMLRPFEKNMIQQFLSPNQMEYVVVLGKNL